MSEMNPLTRKVYDFIVESLTKKGFSPSLREIAKGCYVTHPALYSHLGVLEGKGWIVREYNIPRSIRLGEFAPDYVAPLPDDDEARV